VVVPWLIGVGLPAIRATAARHALVLDDLAIKVVLGLDNAAKEHPAVHAGVGASYSSVDGCAWGALDSGVSMRLLLVGRVPGCSYTCGATSISDAFSLALLYLFRNSFVEFHMIIAYTNVGIENSCCERSTGKMLQAVVHIGDRLRRLRDERYLSQRELADKADVSPATVFKLEANRSEPHPRTIRKLARALGVEPSELAPKE
jgi:DNA-binding XRE family transcriptional regulator